MLPFFRAGATETVEGGDQLSAGLGPPVVVCQSAWRRAGEMLKNSTQPADFTLKGNLFEAF